jgi:hypothetical protein
MLDRARMRRRRRRLLPLPALPLATLGVSGCQTVAVLLVAATVGESKHFHSARGPKKKRVY